MRSSEDRTAIVAGEVENTSFFVPHPYAGNLHPQNTLHQRLYWYWCFFRNERCLSHTETRFTRDMMG